MMRIIIAIREGKIREAVTPFLRSSPMLDATKPATVGPAEHPISPKRARSANIAVPPLESFFEEREKVPGHIIPTAKPIKAMAKSEKTGEGERIRMR